MNLISTIIRIATVFGYKRDINNKIYSRAEQAADELINQLDHLFIEMDNEKRKSKSLVEVSNWQRISDHAFEMFKAYVVESDNSKTFNQTSFKNVNINRIINETIIWKLWVIDQVYAEDKEKIFLSSLIKEFSGSTPHQGQKIDEFNLFILNRLKSYNNTWKENDGGRQFIFAMQLMNNITDDRITSLDGFEMAEIIAATLLYMKYKYMEKNIIIDNLMKVK